jgi:hypothetical protein
MVRILVVKNDAAKLDINLIAERTKEDVKKGTVPDEGIAIFECGKGDIPWDWPEQVIQVGECVADFEVPPSVTIGADGDAEMQLVLIIMDILNGEVEQEDTGEIG